MHTYTTAVRNLNNVKEPLFLVFFLNFVGNDGGEKESI